MKIDLYNFLCILNEKDFRQERKTPLLFVEGVSDRNFLYPLLEAAKFEYGGTEITLKIEKASIFFDVDTRISEIKEKSLIYEKNSIKVLNMKVLNMNLSPILLKLMKSILEDLIK